MLHTKSWKIQQFPAKFHKFLFEANSYPLSMMCSLCIGVCKLMSHCKEISQQRGCSLSTMQNLLPNDFALSCCFTERWNRKRRQYPMNNLCPDGMDLSAAYEHCFKPDFKCKVTDRTCHKYVICRVGGTNELPPPYVSPSVRQTIGQRNPCFEDHIYAAITCCEYICS